MPLHARADGAHGGGVHILHLHHSVRVAHGDDGDRYQAVVRPIQLAAFQNQAPHLPLVIHLRLQPGRDERHLGQLKHRLFHVDAHLAIGQHLKCQQAVQGLYFDL